jgi:epoxyqueuosine reductase QueG
MEHYSNETAALAAGLGWIGKNSKFVSYRFGPRIRLTSLLTNMPLPTAKPDHQNYCGSCTTCVKACPTGALANENWWFGTVDDSLWDASICKGNLAEMDAGNVSLCGKCIQVCPVGR